MVSNNYKQDQETYLSTEGAAKYKKNQEKDPWARFATWCEQRAIARELARYKWELTDRLLDVPCGTGILGQVLQQFPFQIVASDYSQEMMALARTQYPESRLAGFVKADITDTPFPRKSFSCVITLGFLHFAPPEIKHATLKEIAALTNRVAIVTCSVDTPLQRIKQAVLPWIKKRYSPAACPAPLKEIIAECESHGFRVVRAFMTIPLLSAEAILVLEK